MSVTPYSVWWALSGVAVVSMPGQIDDTNCDRVHAALMQAVSSGATVVIADLTGTGSCGYSAAETLVNAQARAVEAGARLKVAAAAGKALLIGQVAGAGHQIDFYQDLEAALAGQRRRGTARAKAVTGRALRLLPVRTAPAVQASQPPPGNRPATPPPRQTPPPGPSPAPA